MFDIFEIFKPVKNNRAQLTLPSVLLIPIILLVIYLLLETTKLSREKVRQQFAVDVSAFVELTAHSNFLNAVAYTNGAFPFRLFRDQFPPDPKTLQLDPARAAPDGFPPMVSVYDGFYEAGAFPTTHNENVYYIPKPTDVEWKLEFMPDAEWMSEDIDLPGGGTGTMSGRGEWMTETPNNIDLEKFYPVTSKEIATYYYFPWEQNSLMLYITMYYLLSQIYENQKKVYERVTKNGEFFRKSFYLNTGNCRMAECGREGSREFNGLVARTLPVYIQKIVMFYNDPSEFPDADAKPAEVPIDMKQDKMLDGQLYQFSYLERSSIERLRRLYRGIDITQSFRAPNNYFNVNLNTNRYRPHVHARVALQCTKESNNCVWPYPTPKYQVRLFP